MMPRVPFEPAVRRALVLVTTAMCMACTRPDADPPPPSAPSAPGDPGDPLDPWLTPGTWTCTRTIETRAIGAPPAAVEATDTTEVRLDGRTPDAVRVHIDGPSPWQLERTVDGVTVTAFGTRIALTRDPASDPRTPAWVGRHAPAPVPGGATGITWRLTTCTPDGCDRCDDAPLADDGCDGCGAPLLEPCPDGTVERTVTTTMLDGQRIVRERCTSAR